MKNSTKNLLVLMCILAGSSCADSDNYKTPADYELTKPIVYKMPGDLDEISGIAFRGGNKDKLYAVQDEDGKLFYFSLGDKKTNYTKFYKKGDYEDLAICNEYAIMLRNDGTLFSFLLSAIDQPEIDTVNEQRGLLPQGEYESLFADQNENSLYILCKNCDNDKRNEMVSGYELQLENDGKLSKKSYFFIDTKIAANLKGEKKINFKPSALAKNKLTGEWYIISSVNKMLLITDDQWKPKFTYLLNPKLFPQPEGIAFDNVGNLYVSNEADGRGCGTVLQFLFKKK